MDWLRRSRRTAAAPDDTPSASAERASPGIGALFSGVREDGSHAVLDLGPAAASSLGVYRRFARRVCFADLLDAAPSPRERASALRALPAQPEAPYDLVFAWDVLDWLLPEERPRLVKRLAEVAAGNARLHIMVDAHERTVRTPLRFTVLDVGRIRYEAAGPPRPAPPPPFPAELERLLAPFRVARAFTAKVGVREYLAVRKDR